MMLKLLFLVIPALGILNNHPTGFSVELEWIRPATAKEISLKVLVKNLSDNSIQIIKNRRQDYKREKIKSAGNYIIELQKRETGQYKLFEPTADIEPSFEKEEYINVEAGKRITDTLYIPGSHFSGTNQKREFPSGIYRLRIWFNANEWDDGPKNCSTWISFKIE